MGANRFLTTPDAKDRAISLLERWYNRLVPRDEPQPYVICAGLVIAEIMRDSYPIKESDYITPKNQVRTSGEKIKKILQRHGFTKILAVEGGRTTRGTRPAAEALVTLLNNDSSLNALSPEERGEVADAVQAWLAGRANDFFNRQRLEIDLDLSKPAAVVVGNILAAAKERGNAGPVAQHLVGAKLQMRYPDANVENRSFTTADQQLGKPGDFVIGGTVLHVTVSPMPALIDKCEKNLRDGYRVYVLVPEPKIQAAREMADQAGLKDKIAIQSIESFVGQNLDEMGEFQKDKLAPGVRKLLEIYDARVAAAETDQSLQIEIPRNLGP